MTAQSEETEERLSFATLQSLNETSDPFSEIRRLGLEKYVAELDEYGYTVIPPDKVAPQSLIDAVREGIIKLAAQAFGLPPTQVNETSAREHPFFFTHNMVAKGEEFEQMLMNPTSLAMVTHLLGESCVLSSMGGFLKGPGDNFLELHTDNVAIPSPFPPYSQVANSTLILTDYSPDGGSICFVPRSHKLGRHPLPEEVNNRNLIVPVEAPAGSLIVFHGNTWHGALPRRTPGYRVTLIQYFARMYLLRQENVNYVTDEMRERNDPRFRRLIGEHIPYPFSLETQDKMFAANAAGKYQHT